MRSRDGFSQRRSRDFLPSGSPLQVSRRGGTDLIGEYSWRGVDTLSVHIDYVLDDQELPVGWGAAEQRRLPVARRGTHGGSLQRNPRASRLATTGMVPRQSYRGVPEIRDVVRPANQDERRLTYSVALRLPAGRVPTSDRLLSPQGLALAQGVESLSPQFSADAIHALGSAEIYFQRPDRRIDGRREYASLFSPYWQARLVETPRSDRILTSPDRGLTVDPFAVLP